MWTPLEQFEVVPLLSVVTAGGNIWPLTNHGLYTLLAAAIVVLIPASSALSSGLVPSRWGASMEALYASVYNLVVGNLGGRVHAGLFPALFTLFTVILVSNLTSNIPYSHAPTASVVTDLGLSFTIWLTTLIVGLQLHGVHFFAFFVPGGTPLGLVPMLTLIETISYVSRAVSLGVRLFANMVAGHALMAILASFIGPLLVSAMFPVGCAALVVFVAIQALELAVAFIQAYVLVVLTSSYARDAIELH
jgi:F-type H+-transporting ATPase subunit a